MRIKDKRSMCSYILMKIFELSEKHYDIGISIITLGMERKIKEDIVSRFILPDDQVFEIGVGTGTLTILCAKRGAYITGIDISTKMLEIAEIKIQRAGVKEKIELKK